MESISPPKRASSLNPAGKSHGMFDVRFFSGADSPFSPFHAGGPDRGNAGFTLIEVIVALIIVSVLAAMIFSTTGGGLRRTARGVGECRTLFELQGRMERIVQIYKKRLADGDGTVDLAEFRSAVVALPDVDIDGTGFLSESGNDFSLTPGATSLFLVTLSRGDHRIASIFAGE